MTESNTSGAISCHRHYFLFKNPTLLHSIAGILQDLILQRELIKKQLPSGSASVGNFEGNFLLLLVSRTLSQASFCTSFCQDTMCHFSDSHCKHPAQGSECLGAQGLYPVASYK